MPPTRRRARGAWIALGALVVAGAVARLAAHERSSLWFDEVITLEEASRPALGETVRAKVLHPPLLRVAARLSIEAFGDPARPEALDLALRLPSALMGTAAIVAVFLFARTYSDDDDLVGLVAAAAWALLPYGIVLSREARFYAALVLFVAWTLYALALLHRRGRAADHVHLALPLVLGCHTHYLFAFVFVFTAATVLPAVVADPRRRWTLLSPWMIAGLAFLPWFVFAAERLSPQDRGWVGPLARHLPDVPVSFFTGRLGYHHLRSRDAVLGGATILIALGIAVHLVLRRARFARLTAVVLFPSLALTACLHQALTETPLFHPKYLAFLYPFACLALGELAAYVLRWAWRPRAAMAAGPSTACAPFALALAIGASVPVGRALGDVYGRAIRPQRQQYAQAARWIAQRRVEGELLVVLECSSRYNQLALRHYGARPPIASLRCRDDGASLPASAAPRTFAVLTHWGEDRVRDAAIEVLRSRYGWITERTVLAGLDGDVVVMALVR